MLKTRRFELLAGGIWLLLIPPGFAGGDRAKTSTLDAVIQGVRGTEELFRNLDFEYQEQYKLLTPKAGLQQGVDYVTATTSTTRLIKQNQRFYYERQSSTEALKTKPQKRLMLSA